MPSEYPQLRATVVEQLPSASASIPVCFQSLFDRQPIEKFETDSAIFWEGDPASHVFDIVEGVLRIVKSLSGGRRVITRFIYPGELLGVSMRDLYLYNAEAVTQTNLRRLPRRHFDHGVSHSPELNSQLFSHLCENLSAAHDQMVLLARKTAEERVCSFLLLAAHRIQRSWQPALIIKIPMPRQDMADYLGLTKETVSRVMSNLANLGVITLSGRHTVAIRNLGSLGLHAGNGEDSEDRPTDGGTARSEKSGSGEQAHAIRQH